MAGLLKYRGRAEAGGETQKSLGHRVATLRSSRELLVAMGSVVPLFNDPRVTLGIGLCVAYLLGVYGWHIVWLHLIFIQVLVAYRQPGTTVAETKALALVREVAIAKTNESDWLRVFLRTFWPMFLKPKASD